MIDWITSNWTGICATIAATVALAHAVVLLTPTKKDDEILAKIDGVLVHLGVEKNPGA
jgi:hypothetical protein